jgi:RNA polymerase sigma-70 factor, ECF subfamily
MERSDTELALAFQQGEQDAFAALYDRYIERIHRFIYYKTFDKDVAEDITSTVFLKAYERIGGFNAARGQFAQWLYGIARNAVIDHYRTLKRHTNIEDVFDLGEDDRTEAKLDAKASLGTVERYLKTLNPRQREIVTLRVWEERSYREIAEIVGGSEDAVKVMFSRTMRELREKLGPHAALVLLLMGCARYLTEFRS